MHHRARRVLAVLAMLTAAALTPVVVTEASAAPQDTSWGAPAGEDDTSWGSTPTDVPADLGDNPAPTPGPGDGTDDTAWG